MPARDAPAFDSTLRANAALPREWRAHLPLPNTVTVWESAVLSQGSLQTLHTLQLCVVCSERGVAALSLMRREGAHLDRGFLRLLRWGRQLLGNDVRRGILQSCFL